MKKPFSALANIKITQNIWLVLLSVVVSVVAWLMIMDYENPITQTTLSNVPINYIGRTSLDDKHLFVESGLVETVDVTVNGSRRNIISLKPTDIKATVNLTEITSGDNRLDVNIKALKSNVNILASNLDEVTIKVDNIIERSFDIALVSDGELASNYYVVAATTTPQSIVVKGPSKDINRIDRIFAIYPLTDAAKSFTYESEIMIVDKEGGTVNNIELASKKVDVSVIVGTQKAVNVIENIVKIEDETLQIMSFSLSDKIVEVKGAVEDLAALQKIHTEPIKIVETKGEQKLEIALKLPENIYLVDDNALTATVDVDKIEEKTFELTKEQVAFSNLNENILALVDDDFSINIRLKGLSRDLASVRSDFITLNVDLAGYENGIHSLPFVVDIPDGVEYIETQGAYIDVEITSLDLDT